MYNVSTKVDLALLHEAGVGFILNARTDVKKLHKAGCDAVGVMGIVPYPKTFFDTYEEAREWLDAEFGTSAWEHCGLCNPR